MILCAIVCCRSDSAKPSSAAAPAIKNVLLITIDTLRPDALSIYGGKVLTPFFHDFAKRALVFDNAFTTAPVTLPAHTSILTGLYPPHHGVRNNGTFRAQEKLLLLPEIAKQHGLQTAAVIGGFPLASQFGLNQGFDLYDDHFNAGSAGNGTFALSEKNAEQVVTAAQKWLSHLSAGDRYFLWLHFFDPHHPYLNHGFPAGDPYHQEVQYVDKNLQNLFAFLQQKKLEEDTLTIILSDHGEAFGEHQEVSHSLFVYNTTLRIPLLISGPGIAAGRRSELARIVDVAPTIEALLQWEPNSKQDGISLMKAGAAENYAETFAPALDFGWSPLQTVHDLHKKYIQAPHPEFYDLDRDPGEEQNLASSTNLEAYRARLRALSGTLNIGPSERYSPNAEERERLQSLGYFAGPSAKQRKDAPDPKDRVAVARQIAELTMQHMPEADRIKAYRNLADEDPLNPLLLSRYAEVLLQQQKYQQAKEVYQRVLDLEYPSASVYNGMAAALFYLGNSAQAEQILQQAVRLGVADGETHYNLGEFLFNRGDRNAAMQEYTQSVAQGFLPAYFRVARLKDISGDNAQAVALLNEAQQKAPDRADVYYERAIVNYRHNRYSEALADFKQALSLTPENTALLYNIGVTYFRLNDLVNARGYLQEFLQKGPAEMKDERQVAQEIIASTRK